MNDVLNQSYSNFTTDAGDLSYFTETYRDYYPAYYTSWISTPNRFEQAFKIASKLISSKRVKVEKVKDFIELVNEIVDAL